MVLTTDHDAQAVKVCSICQAEYKGFGHNAEPINSGRCCTDCNQLVIVARLRRLMRTGKAEVKGEA